MYLKLITTLLVLLLVGKKLRSQDLIWYTAKNGLPSNTVYDVNQDPDGFIWIATNRGVVKFDGINFKIFTLKDGLPNNDIWKLIIQKNGKVWFATKSQYQGYILNDSVYTFPTENGNVISPSSFSMDDRNVWYDYYTLMGQVLVNKISKRIQKEISQRKDLKEALCFYTDDTKEFIFIKTNGIVFTDTNLNLIYEEKCKVWPESFLYSYTPYRRGSLPDGNFYVDFYKKLVLINSKKRLIQIFPTDHIPDEPISSRVRIKNVPNGFQFNYSGHIIRFNYDLEIIDSVSFSAPFQYENGFQDKEGNIWLTSLNKGLGMMPNSMYYAKYFFSNQKTKSMLLLNDSLLVSVEEIGLNLIDKQSHKTKTIIDNKENYPVYQVLKDSKMNHILMINATNSLVCKGENTKKIKVLITQKNGMTSYLSGMKFIYPYQSFMYGITHNYIMKCDREIKYGSVLQYKAGLICIHAFQKHLFFGGSDGLHFLDEDSLVKVKGGEILNVKINCMSNNTSYLIVGTGGRGVYLYRNDKVIQINSTDGLMVQKIIQHGPMLWLATQNGVKKILLNYQNLQDSEIIDHFYESDGLLQNNTNDILIDPPYLYATSDIGLVKINFQDSIYKQSPQFYFKTDVDTLKYFYSDTALVKIKYSVLNYVHQGHYKFEYRLLPTQKKWVNTSNQSLDFIGLLPNLYTLEVKVTDHHFNNRITRLYIQISPAWWQTKIAKVLFVVLFILGFIGVVKWVQIRIRKKEQIKSSYEKRVAGLELQALRSQMNPHFVFNSLNAIQYYIQRNEMDTSEDYLVKFSKLIRLYFEYSRRQDVSLKEEINLLEHYLTIEQLRFEENLNYTIQVDNRIDLEEQVLPAMVLQPIIENSVNHGIFHKGGKGLIFVDFIFINEITFQVDVKDNGIGLEKAKEIKKKSLKNYKSHSSDVLAERIALLNQEKKWKIQFSIDDFSELERERETGTLVTLIFNKLI